jgi:vesicle transport protein SEC22
MVLMTMIARVFDGLPLAASVQEDEQTGKSILEYQNQAKRLFKTLSDNSPQRCSIETGNGQYIFHYIIEQQSCFLTLTEMHFSKKNAYAFLDDLAQEFHNQYGHKINTATRPYSFIEFDTYIQKAKKTYSDNRGRRNLNNLNTELQDVQRIMVQNIDDVLQRGAVLSEMENKSQNLTEMSRKYRKDAESLNATSLAVIAGACGGGFLLLLLIYFWVL